MNDINNSSPKTKLKNSSNPNVEIEQLRDEIYFWRTQLQNRLHHDEPISMKINEALESATNKLNLYPEDELHEFVTPELVQNRLAAKRLIIGYEKFFISVSSSLPSTLRKVNDASNIKFGRRYQDDIFLSVQALYPEVSMAQVMDLAKTIWSHHR